MEWRKYIVLALLFLFFCKILAANDGQAYASIIQDSRFSQGGLYIYSRMHPVNAVVEITNPLNGISRTASVLAGFPSGNASIGLSPQLADELSIQYPTLVYYRSGGGGIDLPYHPDPDVNPGAGIITELDLPLEPQSLPPSEDFTESSPLPELQDPGIPLTSDSEGPVAMPSSPESQGPEVSSLPDSEGLDASPEEEMLQGDVEASPSPELQDPGVPLTSDSEGPVAMPSSPESQGPEVSSLPDSEGLDASPEEEMLQGDVEASPSPELQDPGVPLTSDSESSVAMPSSAELQGPEVSSLPDSEGLDALPEEEMLEGEVVPSTATADDVITSAPFLEDASPVLDDIQEQQGEDTFALDSDPPTPASDEEVELFAPIPFSRSSPLAEDELQGPLEESSLAIEIPGQRDAIAEDGEVAEFYDGRSIPEYDEVVELATPDPYPLFSPLAEDELQGPLEESNLAMDIPEQREAVTEDGETAEFDDGRSVPDEVMELVTPDPSSPSSPFAEDELRDPLGESSLAMDIPEQREAVTEDSEVDEFHDERSMPEFDEAVELATPDPFLLSPPSLNGGLQRSLGESDFVIDQPQQKDPVIEAADEQFIIPELSSDDFTLNAPERSILPFQDNIPPPELQGAPFLALPEMKDTEQPAAAQDTEQDESIEEQFTLMDIEATPHEEESIEQTTQLASSGIEEEVRVEQPIEATHTFNQDAYYAQVGAYESKNNADGVHEELGGEFPSFVYKDDEERILYKVFIGPVSSDERGIMRYLLKAKGFTSFFRKGDTFF